MEFLSNYLALFCGDLPTQHEVQAALCNFHNASTLFVEQKIDSI